MTERTAPGKVILFGEHAVVYGKPAVAVPVQSTRARAQVVDLPDDPAGWVRLEAPGTQLSAWLHEMPEANPLATAVRLILKDLGRDRGSALRVTIESEIPVGAGMGSSAAVSVAVLRAVAAHLGHELSAERVSGLAFEVEKLQHGTPSGIDNTVVAYERPLYFISGQPLQFLQVGRPFTLIIGDSGDRLPTRDSVAAVRERRAADLQSVERVFAEIAAISEQGRRLIESGDTPPLGPLLDRNQTLLKAIGVSGKGLEGLIRAAKRAGALGAKLSGAGRGGIMIALVEPASAEAVGIALREAGATRTIRTEVAA
jgi:mevalonate kinase